MKWEYTVIRVSENISEKVKDFYHLGKSEWELVSVDNGIAYFKRPDFAHEKREVEYLGGKIG